MTPEDEITGMGEVPRRLERKHMEGPRLRVIIEILVVTAICWLAANALRDATFQASTLEQLKQIQTEVKAIAHVVHPTYGDPP